MVALAAISSLSGVVSYQALEVGMRNEMVKPGDLLSGSLGVFKLICLSNLG